MPKKSKTFFIVNVMEKNLILLAFSEILQRKLRKTTTGFKNGFIMKVKNMLTRPRTTFLPIINYFSLPLKF